MAVGGHGEPRGSDAETVVAFTTVSACARTQPDSPEVRFAGPTWNSKGSSAPPAIACCCCTVTDSWPRRDASNKSRTRVVVVAVVVVVVIAVFAFAFTVAFAPATPTSASRRQPASFGVDLDEPWVPRIMWRRARARRVPTMSLTRGWMPLFWKFQVRLREYLMMMLLLLLLVVVVLVVLLLLLLVVVLLLLLSRR